MVGGLSSVAPGYGSAGDSGATASYGSQCFHPSPKGPTAQVDDGDSGTSEAAARPSA